MTIPNHDAPTQLMREGTFERPFCSQSEHGVRTRRWPATYQAFLMLPFLLTIVAMALVSRNARAPAALLVPFRKEER